MRLFVVTYDHPDEQGWQQQVMPHVGWLQDRIADGSLLASGPFLDEQTKSAMLIMAAIDREALDALIASDPFAIHGLIKNMSVRAWDPIFGAFNASSTMPGQMQRRRTN